MYVEIWFMFLMYVNIVYLIFIDLCFEILVNSFKLLMNVKCLYIFILYSFIDENVI